MINQQLLQYIKSQREAGTSDEEIKENLSAAGWRDEDIAEGFDAVSGPDDTSPQSHQEVRQEATQERNQKQTDESNQNDQAAAQQEQPKAQNATSDQYRETVEANDQQSPQSGDGQGTQGQQSSAAAADATDRRHAANENPQELRTMEADKKRYGNAATASNAEQEKTQPEKTQSTSPGQEKSADAQPKAKKNQQSQKTQAENETASQYHPTEAKQQGRKKERSSSQARQRPQKTKTQGGSSTQSKRATPNQQQSKQRSTQAAKGQKPRKQRSQIQQARQQSASTSIATIILSILVLLLIGGGAAYAYLNYFQGPTAETSSSEVMEALANSESFEYRIGIGRQVDGGSTSEETLVIEGAVDRSSEAESYYTITRPDQPGESSVNGVASEFSEYANLDPRQKQTINQSLLDPGFFTVREFQTTQQLGATENSSGFNTNRFGVTADPTQLASTYSTIYETIYGESVPSSVWSTLQNNLDQFSTQQGQLWVHPTSSVPYQMTFIGSDSDGNNLQVNMQFRDHGGDVSSAPRTYESRPVVSGLADALNRGSDDDSPDLPNNPSTTTEAATTTQNSQATTTNDGDDTDTANQQNQAREQDRLRINDIQQIQIALEMFARSQGNYPARFSGLTFGDMFEFAPRDPESGNPYSYVRISPNRYHLGATLRATSDAELPANDADYDSSNDAENGFSGSANTCGDLQNESQQGTACFDVTGQISN